MKKKAAIVCLASAISLIALPALGAGYFNSYLYNVRVGFDSRYWLDDATDGYTHIDLSYCSVFGNSALFTSTQIGLLSTSGYHRSDVNHCDRSSFFVTDSGTYYFEIEKINGSSSTSQTLSSQYLVVNY